ncbi:hypothetical protein [Krasilnikovia sp. MM14-A1004]|uniref:hypothetical protein n=1 Tax=Krasilnikovia sp. MM14-A1004 TaxID=3373541 RepID=UPI00399CB6EA
MNRVAWILVIVLGSLLSADITHQIWLALGGTPLEALGAAGATGLGAFSIGMTLYRLFRTTES